MPDNNVIHINEFNELKKIEENKIEKLCETMETKITYSKNKIEMVGELDPDAEVSNICLSKIDPSIHLQITTTIPVTSGDLEELFIWLNDNRVGSWEGEWKLTLEKISPGQLENEFITGKEDVMNEDCKEGGAKIICEHCKKEFNPAL